MENYKLIIYILIGLIYFIFKNRKKLPKAESPAPARAPNTSPIPRKTTLLNKGKEVLEKSKQTEITKTLESTGLHKSSQVIDYDDLLTDEEGKPTDIAMKDSDREGKEKFEPYSNRQTESEYGILLKNPETLKQAMVLNEILAPKHF